MKYPMAVLVVALAACSNDRSEHKAQHQAAKPAPTVVPRGVRQHGTGITNKYNGADISHGKRLKGGETVSDQRIEELEREVAKLQEFRDDILPVIKDFWKREIRETGGGTIHSSLAKFYMKYFAGETIEI